MFEGVLPAIITPFKKTPAMALDIPGLERNIGFLLASGIHGIVPCGSTGESATLTFEVHWQIVDKVVSEAHTPNQYGLITQERAEKFDLLGQLILNQRETIVVCGAEGIGKTTLLNTFKKVRGNIWPICVLQGQEILGVEHIKTLLVLTIQQHHTELLGHDLSLMFSFCEQRQQKVVLIIDDAVRLAAGVITTLAEYALQNPILRVVFAFTREQLYLKNLTDSVIEDCYFVEIPPLTKPQTAVFLQELSQHPETAVEYQIQELDDKLLDKLYQGTGGIPGKIIADFPLLIAQEKTKTFPALRVFLLIGIFCLSGVLFYLHNNSRYNKDLASQTVLSSVPLKPVKAVTVIKPQVIVTIQPGNAVSNEVAKATKLAEATQAIELQENQQRLDYDADEQWALQQTGKYYTLQLMALSKRQALENIVKKHQNLQLQLRILQVKKNYVLLYGSFADTKTANNAIKLLPAEFKHAWPRKIDILQKEIKN